MEDSNTPETPFEYESDQPPSIAIVNALADLEGVDPTELDYILYDYIHPEALDTLTESGPATVTFPLEEYTISTTESGTVQITS